MPWPRGRRTLPRSQDSEDQTSALSSGPGVGFEPLRRSCQQEAGGSGGVAPELKPLASASPTEDQNKDAWLRNAERAASVAAAAFVLMVKAPYKGIL